MIIRVLKIIIIKLDAWVHKIEDWLDAKAKPVEIVPQEIVKAVEPIVAPAEEKKE